MNKIKNPVAPTCKDSRSGQTTPTGDAESAPCKSAEPAGLSSRRISNSIPGTCPSQTVRKPALPVI